MMQRAGMALQLKQTALRRGRQVILQPLDLALPPTGTVAIIGPNGAGKSSLLSLMPCCWTGRIYPA